MSTSPFSRNFKYGNEAFDNGDYSAAKSYYGAAFDIAERNGDEVNKEIARFWYAWSDFLLGNYYTALRNFLITVENLDVLKKMNYPYEYRVYYNLASVYEEIGQWINVREMLLNALNTPYAQENPDRKMAVMWYIGDTYRELGETDKAWQYYNEVKEYYLQSDKKEEVLNLNVDIAKLMNVENKTDEAIELLEKTYTNIQNAEIDYLIEPCLDTLAVLYYKKVKEEPENNLTYFDRIKRRLIERMEKAEEQQQTGEELQWFAWLSKFSAVTDDKEIFEKSNKFCAKMAETIQHLPSSYTFDDLKHLLEIYKDYADYLYSKIESKGPNITNFLTLKYYKIVDYLVDKITAKILSPTPRRNFHIGYTYIAYRIYSLYQIIYQEYWEDFLYEALGTIEKYKGYDLFIHFESDTSRREFLDKLNELEYKIILKQKHLEKEKDEDKKEELKKEIETLQNKYYDIENEMAIQRSAWISTKDPVKLMEETMHEIQPLINYYPYGLIYFAMSENILYVTVFTKDKIIKEDIEFPAEKIEKAEALLTYIREQAAAIETIEDILQLDKILMKLSKWISKRVVTDKVKEAIKDLEYLTIIPSGLFINFPVEILQIDGEFFGTKYKLSREFNLKFLAEQMKEIIYQKKSETAHLDILRAKEDVLFVSNPNYKESLIPGESEIELRIVSNELIAKTEEDYIALRAQGKRVYREDETVSMDLGETEVQSVVKLFEEKNVPYTALINEEVTKESLLEHLNSNNKIFHFAGHAIFDDKEPNFSKLVLRSGEVLTPVDLTKVHFEYNPLLVFSACESGVSEVQEGDEPFGFLRFAKIMKAQNIIFSLWPVLSEPTTVLMLSFYSNILQGKEIADAMRLARKELIKQVNNGEGKMKKYTNLKLFHWSPFSFIGLPFYYYQIKEAEK